MPINKLLQFVLAAAVSLVGLVGLYIMYTSETATAHPDQYVLYFNWAAGAGLVFLAVGAALTIFDREETIVTEFNEEKVRK